jgi:preprotein translocase subunit SecG
MKLTSIFGIVQIVISLMLIAAILLQQRGVGLSATFGGEGNIYRTKRGIEKALFIGTIVLSVLFFGISLATFIVAPR